MAFTVRDFHSLVRLLEERPEWRAQLRRLLLSQELLRLPRLVRQLSADVQQLQQTVSQLVEAQKDAERRLQRLEEVTARLAGAQEQTEQRLQRLEEVTTSLAEAQRRTEQTVARLVEAQEGTERRLQRLEEVVGELVGAVGALKGESLERRYRERAASYFQRVLRRIRVVDHQQLGLLLDDAVDQGRITAEERAQVLEADVVVTGLFDGREVYLLAEVSGTVTAHDVRRARERAAALEKATGCPVLLAVAGQELEEAAGVWGGSELSGVGSFGGRAVAARAVLARCFGV